MTNYEQAIAWIHSREKFKVKPGLKRMEWMMERLGHPERELTSIHVAGTNGKGSTISFLNHLLQAQGYRVGTFTSPYVTRFNERISINSEPIEDEQLARLVVDIKPIAEELANTEWGEPTEFEVITAMSILYFSQREVDMVLFEAGLGGRYDSTNVITPLISVITNVGLDHMDILGDTYEEIAKEKAGIIKPKVPVITAAKHPEVLDIFYMTAYELEAPIYSRENDYKVTHISSEREGEAFFFSNEEGFEGEFSTSMMGHHQVENAALALKTVEVLKKMGIAIDRVKYKQALLDTCWPARFEILSKQPTVILDGAHNKEGTEALVEAIKSHYPGQSVYMLYAAIEGKPVHEMLKLLDEVVEKVWFTTFDFPKSLTGDQLKQRSTMKGSVVEADYKKAFHDIYHDLSHSDILLVTGSLYFASVFRKYFESKK